jgi:DNA polymerase
MYKIVIDFETRSAVDLKRAGVYRYAEDPSTEILCLGWGGNDLSLARKQFAIPGPVSAWIPSRGGEFPQAIIDHMGRSGRFAAHHSIFELEIWNRVLRRDRPEIPRLEPRHILGHDTMLRCAIWGLPQSLDAAAEALGCKERKDPNGRALLAKLCRPKARDGTAPAFHDPSPAELDALAAYCAQDVRVEQELDALLPLPFLTVMDEALTAERMNREGLLIDGLRLKRLRDMMEATVPMLDARMREITGGKVGSARAVTALLAWLRSEGVEGLESVARKDLEEALEGLAEDGGGSPRAREAIATRLAAARSSVGKLAAFDAMAGMWDGRIRGAFTFYGAGRTGRYAGSGVQLQNLPRPSESGEALERRLKRIEDGREPPTLEAVSNALRSLIIPRPGWDAAVIDLSQIEARVLAWLAGQDDLLGAFRRGEDVYTYDAKGVGSDNRQLGKTLRLGLGYGMGAAKFMETAASRGVALHPEESAAIVAAWRRNNKAIVDWWWKLEAGFRRSTENPGAWGPWDPRLPKVRFGTFHRPDGSGREVATLYVQLPSMRWIAYRDPLSRRDENPSYLGVNPVTRKWERIPTWGGKLAENIVQAVARDVLCVLMTLIRKYDADVRAILCGCVHDEVIVETHPTISKTFLADMTAVLREGSIRKHSRMKLPEWMAGLPLDASGRICDRYGK